MVSKITWVPSKLEDVKPGWNELVVKTVQFGLQKMVMEKDVPIKMRDGVTLYCNVFRPIKPGRFPVVMSADVYGKDGDGRQTHERF
ncbi:MAG: hypothetical protein Q7R45_03155, partial [Sulfuricaulis sp.]|nr:hypothetical protein [Sulfuricaulis sp.]